MAEGFFFFLSLLSFCSYTSAKTEGVRWVQLHPFREKIALFSEYK